MDSRAILLAATFLFCAVICNGTRLPKRPFYLRYGGNRPISSGYSYQTKTFQQQVDHFDYENNKTFSHRYVVNDNWWKPGKPIFFYTGNEGDITWFCNNTGLMWDLAPEYNAMLVFSEHRYYGESLPFGNNSFTQENINFFNVEQALADHATLINYIKSSVNGTQNSSVIAFGGSYGGMLATWIRMKYPNLVNGSLAASAPIWLFGDLTPCQAPYKVLTEAYDKAHPLCPLAIRMSWDALTRIGSSKDGLSWLHDTFKLCDAPKDVNGLTDWLKEIWFDLGMANYPYPASFLEPLPAWPVKEACKVLSTKIFRFDRELLMAIAEASSVYYNYSGSAQCLNLNQQAVQSLGDQGWNFQACTEMVMPLCTNGIDDMYPAELWDIKEFAASCKELTRMDLTLKPNWIIQQYGGKDISSFTNILFSNGGLDPWSAGGVLKSLTKDLPAVFIPDGAHHLDLRAATHMEDPQDLKHARMVERDFINKLL